ncbi:hypothetical protein FRC17_001428 [Serendipita sp. 399]|nr:hypothetical protein FRC17_001428 [Serendipita sp. 399]
MVSSKCVVYGVLTTPLDLRQVNESGVGLKAMPLLGRFWDPLLGVFTGVLAFQLRQNNPETAPPPNERLDHLLKWKYNRWIESRKEQQNQGEAEFWTALSNEEQKQASQALSTQA